MFDGEADDPVGNGLRASARRLGGVAVFSGVVNLLTLSGSIYMLQVYDRVIPSRSVGTLVGLSALALVAFAVQAYLDALRSRMLARAAALFDVSLQEPIHLALATLPLRGVRPIVTQQPLRDLDQIRAFLSGMGPTAFLDMPWAPIFLIALFVFHPVIGLVATLGGAAIVAMTWVTERQSRAPSLAATERSAQRQVLADATRINADVIRALGMTRRLTARWSEVNERFLQENLRAMDVQANLGSIAKMLRFVLQSAMLGVGAYLVVNEQASGGIMIASSIMMGRALAPVEVALGTWKQMVAARQAVKRLRDVLRVAATPSATVSLPRPTRELTVEMLAVAPPGTDRPIVSDVSFSLYAGMGLALVGPSASGKSTLAKALVGLWPPRGGAVRLDGAALDQWAHDDLGRCLGYLPQEVALFDGTVAENIARFDEAATAEQVIDAAMTAGAHDLILRLPQGYATRIGEGGAALSGGQRQRIGLARAVFGDPFLVVLDEPNANLDAAGEAALTGAITALRARNCIVVVVSHRPNALQALDMAMIVIEGRVQAFGPRDEVFGALLRAAKPGPSAAQTIRGAA
ncbi:type I secretion system ABC transporter, PrtD family [Rhodoblastus acidophilus]|uniref:Type I secretion system ABC transporter, PrtD family n=2 Tax=Rhodoblastus acidophilus TaxID=1074 RepID=A0A212S4P9_RHOAC|nr:type I secretion system permease/ATPase [Rhodoblastus acidophilus]PPQ37759.1 type I secretion system permease/ATPase [Rhodoblastus acidophilus]SNB80188.1 type I secretion system ABC transporter, PrtD family [Rhodoblastus acidophilus]